MLTKMALEQIRGTWEYRRCVNFDYSDVVELIICSVIMLPLALALDIATFPFQLLIFIVYQISQRGV